MFYKKERDSLLPYGERHRADDCREERKLRHEKSETYYLLACTLWELRTYGSSRAVGHKERHGQLLTVEPLVTITHSHCEIYWLL
jgi:hypothetical protein